MNDTPSIALTEAELKRLTGYEQATKQLNVLHARGFLRAYINKDGDVVLSRVHFNAVEGGELHRPIKGANLHIFRKAA